MTNIKCNGNKEIDLLAIEPKSMKKYHVESRGSTIFRLKSEDIFSNRLGSGIPLRDGIAFFHNSKFNHEKIKEKILEIFGNETYEKVLVVYDVKDDSVIPTADKLFGIKVWLLKNLLAELMKKGVSGSRDDVLRLAEFFNRYMQDAESKKTNLLK